MHTLITEVKRAERRPFIREIASEPAPTEDKPEMTETKIPRGTGRPRMGAAAWASAVDRR